MRPQLRATLAHVVFHKVVLLRLILTSSSPIRQSMLDAAGVVHEAMSPAVDEASLKQGQPDPAQVARYVVTVIWGMSVQAAGGAGREQLEEVARVAMRCWPE